MNYSFKCNLICVVLKSFTPRLLPSQFTHGAYNGFNPENYLSDLQYAPFHVAEIFEDVDDQYWFCGSLITNITNEHTSLKTKSVRPNKPPFLNKKYQRAIMDKARLKHRYNRYPSFRNWENYHVQRNLATNIRRKSTCAYFQKNCTSSDSSFFKVINHFSQKKVTRTVLACISRMEIK